MELFTGYAVFNWVATWANPSCDLIFRAATDLGDHVIYFLAITPLFWVVDRRRAGVLFLFLLASGLLNTGLKLWIHTPRPDPALARVLDFRPYRSGSYAFPSGHAQNAVVFWGYLAWWVGRRWFSALAVFFVAAISFSRLYLAVHFPIDILGGFGLGVALLLGLGNVAGRWARADFRTSAAVAGVIGAACRGLTLWSADLTIASICGGLIGFLTGAVWLPQSPLVFRNTVQLVVGVCGGLLLMGLLLVLFQSIPPNPIAVCAQVTVLWIVALWAYPHVLRRMWLVREAELLQAE